MSGNTLHGLVKHGIRLSYSRNPLSVRVPTNAGGNNGGPTLQQQQQPMQTLHHAQQQGPSMMQHFSQAPPPSLAPPNGLGLSDNFAGHHPSHHRRVQLPTTILRRASALSPRFSSSLAWQTLGQPFDASPNNNYGSSSSHSNVLPSGGGGPSPPPRLYATSPAGMTSMPLTGALSVPRSSAAMANGIFGTGYSTTFSPFGVPFASGDTSGGESGSEGGRPQHIPGVQQQWHQQQQLDTRFGYASSATPVKPFRKGSASDTDSRRMEGWHVR